jgi:hypothetical protein
MKVLHSLRRFATGWCALVPLLCLAGCSTPRYGLRPVPTEAFQCVAVGGADFLEATGHPATFWVAADVFDFLDSKYLMTAVIVSNASTAPFEISYDSLKMVGFPGGARQTLAPLEPEALVQRMAKERASHNSSRNWGTFLLALAAARHDPGASADIGKVDRTVESHNAVTRLQSQQASDVVRYLDRFMLRRRSVEPMSTGGGYVLFPFVKSDSYNLHVKVGGESRKFSFTLRSY